MASQASRDRQRRAKRRRTTGLLEYLVSGGSEASRRRRPLAAYDRSLALERLEDRCLLAGFSDTASQLNLVLAADQNVGIISTGTAYTLTLDSGTWSGTDDSKVSGNGTSTLSVSSTGISDFTSGINITDTGSTEGDGVTFNTSQASGYFNNFVITLSHSSATGLAFNGATSFENSAALTAAVNGAVTINSAAVLTSQAGSITLETTGTNTALTAGGNVLSQSGAIALQATGNVTVSSGITINSGSAPLTLAADVTAAGAGDDGVGTLSINAGATVTTTGTITLRGADVSIDTSSDPAVVGATRALATTPGATLTGLDTPEALAFDSSGNLYVANVNDTVSEFAPGATTPGATLTGVDTPDALAFDSSGNLYVANFSGRTVSEFAPGATTPSATLTGLNVPYALAFDSSGNLYVANYNNGTVSEFAPGATTPSATLTGLDNPMALAFDSSGNLYVANAGSTTVSEFAPGATTPGATLTGVDAPDALAFDSSGNLYVANFFDGTVSKFAPGATTPSATLTGLNNPYALAFDASGNLYVANFGNKTVSEFAPGATTPSATLTGLNVPYALAFDSSGNLYVANEASGTVSKFAPASVTATAAGVVIQSSLESRPMLIGGTNSTPVAGINLTSDELAQIFTTAAGTVTIGDSAETGNITLSTATPATTAGAAVNVIESTSGAGAIILDDASGAGTGLNGNGGLVSLTPGTGSVQTTLFSTGTPLATQGFTASGPLNLSLGFAPTVGTQLTIISNTATPVNSNFISGTFSNLAQNGTATLSYLGTPYTFQANYQSGDGNDLVLTDLGIATTTTVSAAPGPSTYGQSVTFTATVTSGGSAMTAGSVTFEEGGTILASDVALNGSGMAAFAISSLSVAASPYTISAIYNNTSPYATSSGSTSQTVNPAPLTITADNQTKAYGAALPTLTVSYAGFVNGDTAANLTTAPTVTTTATASSHVSGNPYAVTASGAVDSDYTISYVAGTLTVDPVALTITAENQIKAYAATLPTLTVSYAGFVNGDTAANLTTAPTVATTATASSHVSGNPYSITASGAVDSDYTISYVAGALTVDPVALTITAGNQTKAYAATLPTLTVSYAGFVNGDTAANLTTAPTVATTATASSHVSGNPYSITASGAVDSDYTISYVAGALTVDPVALTITADNQTKAYGAALPTLTVSYSGFVNGDTAANLTTAPTVTTTATASSHVSGNPYSITASGAVDSDYTISYVAGALTVDPVALTITAENQTKAYAATLPTLTVSYAGFVNGDTAANLTTAPTVATTATASSHVSGNPYSITASGAVDSDYTISYVAGALTVDPVALTITAGNQTKAYAATLPTLTVSYAGFVNGDTAASLTMAPTVTTTATASSHVSGSPYSITASGAVDSDYTISYVAGALTVDPVALTITADNQTKAYGAALPTLTVSYSGFVNGDTAANLTTAPTATTTATAASQVSNSPYSITASGAVDSDYTISYVAGTLTVDPVALTITADNQTKAYAAALPTLTVSYAGFVNGDTAANLTTAPTVATTATASSHVSGNPYSITASGAVDSDYTISYVAGALTVDPVALTITAENQTKAYAAALPTLTVSYAGFVNGDTADSLTTAPTVTTTATASSHVSGNPYSITASGAVDSDYTISYVAGALTVDPVALTITAENQTKAYAATLPTLTVSYAGFVNGDTAANLTTAPTVTTTATASSHVSGNPYSITASGAVDSDYTISYVAGALTVDPVALTITAENQTKAYAAALPTLTVSYAGFVNGDTAANLTTAPTVTTTATASSHVSGNPYSITASGAVDSDYTISYIAGALTVDPVPLTITAGNQTKAYAATLPTLTVSYSGFVNGDTAANLTTAPTVTTTATASSHVSGNPYSITASGAVDSDYTISYVAGTLTVDPVALTITAGNQTKAYGAALPTLTVSYSGFVNGDTAANLTTAPTVTTTATAASQVSNSPYSITASGAVDSDYTISYVAGALTVDPVALTITAGNQTKAYGAALPTLTVSYAGFVNGDTAANLTTAPTVTTTATASSHVSGNPYSITASGAVDSDYTISYVAGTLTVDPVALTITADNQTKAYAAALPTLTVSYSGFVNGDTAANLTTAPTVTTTATASSHVSGNPYSITASGAVDSDYTISYVAGALTVDPVALTITADNQTKAYAATLPTLTVSYAGFVNGDTAANLTTAPTVATTATASSHVSGNPYSITASGAVDSDYTISYVAGALTVDPVALTITADNQTKAYAAALPTLTVSYAGFVNGDTAANLTTAPTVTTTATASSHVSGNPYSITASGAVDSDYTISYVAGTLTVDPVALTITADNQTKAYGAALPTLTVSYSGFVNGDTAANLTTAPTVTTTATASSHVSGNPYSITASGAVDSDYTISYVAGTLTVDPVALTITADNQTKAYGAALPTLTVSYSGFVNGDTAANLTTAPTVTTTATASSHVSGNPYSITASGAVDSDYTISYVAGALTVDPVALTITADNQTKAYGAALPTLTVSYAGFVNGDTAANLTTAPTATTTATAASQVSGSPYSITASGAVDSDYTISYVAGALTVDPVAATWTTNPNSKTYGSADPSPLTTGSGTFLAADNVTATYSRVAGEDVGGYPITATLSSTTLTAAQLAADYIITNAGATFTIIAATSAPNFAEVYTVPGTPGAAETLDVDWVSRQAAYNDEVGWFTVSSLSGTVGGVAPGASGYAQAAVTSTSHVIFPSGDQGGESATLSVQGGQLIVFYLVQNATTADFLANNPSDSISGSPLIFFTATAANPDNFQHVQVIQNPTIGQVQYNWEDMNTGGDKDFNDVVMTVSPAGTPSGSIDALQVPGSGSAVNIAAVLLGDTSLDSAPGDIGFYYVSDASGDVAGIAPGSPGYAAAALTSGNYQVLFGPGASADNIASDSAPAGSYIAFYAISNGTTSQFMATNSNNSATGGPVSFFSFTSANPDSTDHFRFFSPEGVATNPSQLTLHIMDQLFGNDNDYDGLALNLNIGSS